MLESELFQPVVALLTSQGYTLKGEVGALDIFGMKEDSTVGIELKVKVSLKLIYQAVDRQRLCDVVYIALPEHVIHHKKTNYKSFVALIRRLELGLIVVTASRAYVEVEAIPYDREKSRIVNKSKKQRLVKEFLSRENNVTIGGSKGVRLTAYRERAIKLANALNMKSPASPSELKKTTGVHDAASILRMNYYGWFSKVSRGLYTLTSTLEGNKL